MLMRKHLSCNWTVDIANWMVVDSSDSGYQLLTDEEIQQVVDAT